MKLSIMNRLKQLLLDGIPSWCRDIVVVGDVYTNTPTDISGKSIGCLLVAVSPMQRANDISVLSVRGAIPRM